MTTQQPATEAGRRLVGRIPSVFRDSDPWDEWVVAIEAEARAGALDVDALTRAIEGQNLYHGRHGTTPAGRATAMAIRAAILAEQKPSWRDDLRADVKRVKDIDRSGW